MTTLDWIIKGVENGLVRYILIALLVYVFSAVVSAAIGRMPLHAVRPTRKQLIREFIYSFSTIVVIATIVSISIDMNIMKITPSRGVGASVVTVALLILLHDTWFYWTHRLLHTRVMIRFHRVHHLSAKPTVWTAYAFHPIEAIINGVFVIAMSPFIPVTFPVLTAFMFFMLARNMLGHCGREVFPATRSGVPLISWSTTVTHHDLHHRFAKGNYGLYFTYWDRLMGTEHPAYSEMFRAAVIVPTSKTRASEHNAGS